MEHSILAQLRVEPIGGDVSMAQEIEAAIQALERRDLTVHRGPMGTTIEAPSLDDVLDGVRAAHRAACHAAPRVLTTVTIDERGGPGERLNERLPTGTTGSS